MNSKPKSIDMGSLIQKVTKRARELLKKKSKPQTKGKSANGTSRYSKSKRQKLLIGGVSVKLDEDKKAAILNIIGIKTKEAGKEKAQAHLVELLKLKTIQKIESKLVDYTTKIREDGRNLYNADEAKEINRIEKVLRDVGKALKLSTDDDFKKFQERLTDFARIYEDSNNPNAGIDVAHIINYENKMYEYNLFTGNKSDYELCNIEKEITALNIFKLFYDLTTMKEDQHGGMRGGAYADLFSEYDKDDEDKIISVKTYSKAQENENFTERLKAYNDLLKVSKDTIRDTRKEFVSVGLVIEQEKKGKKSTNHDEVSPGYIPTKMNTTEIILDEHQASVEDNILLKDDEFTNLTDEQREEFKNILNEVKDGGIINTLEHTDKGETFKWGISNGETDKIFTLYTFNNRRAELNEQLLQVAKNNNISEKGTTLLTSSSYGTLLKAIETLNANIRKLEVEYAKAKAIINVKSISTLISTIKKDIETIKKSHNDFVGKNKYEFLRPDSLVEADLVDNSDLALKRAAAFSGGNPAKYKSTGQVVHIMFQNKKYKRVIYMKEKRNTKYCKMNNEYILLSKLKVVE